VEIAPSVIVNASKNVWTIAVADAWPMDVVGVPRMEPASTPPTAAMCSWHVAPLMILSKHVPMMLQMPAMRQFQFLSRSAL
jgi:hypothetical protein